MGTNSSYRASREIKSYYLSKGLSVMPDMWKSHNLRGQMLFLFCCSHYRQIFILFTCFTTLINWLERTIKPHHLFMNKWWLKLERANIKMLTRIFANKLAEWIFLILSILCNQNGHNALLSFYWSLDKFLPCYRPPTFLSLEHLFWKTCNCKCFLCQFRM